MSDATKYPVPQEERGLRRFLVHDHYDNCHERFDSLSEALDHATDLVEDYREDAGDGGWKGDGDVEVLMVVQRWSIVPIEKPADADPDVGDDWADMLEADVPGAHPLTLDEIGAVLKASLSATEADAVMQALKDAALAKANGTTTREGNGGNDHA